MSERLFSPKQQRAQTAAWIGGSVTVLLLIIYAMLPRPDRPPSRVTIDLKTARQAAAWLTIPQTPAARPPSALAEFGKSLFHDRRLSVDGSRSCAGCHDPKTESRDNDLVGWDPPHLVDLHLTHWFFHDGRQDSLMGAVLESLEHADELGSNRAHIIRNVRQHYSKTYESLFGTFPQTLPKKLPMNAYPGSSQPIPLPIEVASVALASLGSTPVLTDVLETARKNYRVPATELSRRALIDKMSQNTWIEAYAALPVAEKSAMNKAFLNVGRAIAAYLETLRSDPTAFDRFAQKLKHAASIQMALNEDFGIRELEGFALFVGDGGCIRCHNGPLLSDQQFHNIGLPSKDQHIHLGRTTGILRLLSSPYHCRATLLNQSPVRSESCKQLPFLWPEAPTQLGAFKTSRLRHIAETAPYMHDGRYTDLTAVLGYYSSLSSKAAAGHSSPLLLPLQLTENEQEALLAFLGSLSSPIANHSDPLPIP